MPDFDLSDSGGIALVLLRGLVDCAVLLVGGMVLFRLLVVRAASARLAETDTAFVSLWLRRGQRGLSVLTMLLLALWLAGVAQSLSDATDWSGLWTAIGTVLRATRFGQTVIAQVAVLIVLATRPARWVKLRDMLDGLATLALITLAAAHGHAFSMGNIGLYLSTILHLAAASAWLGALPPLLVFAAVLPKDAAVALLRAFSPIGQIAVLMIGITALLQGVVMIQTPESLLTTAYGWVACGKIMLFALLLILAAFNYWRGTAGLGQGNRRPILISLMYENVLGFLVVLAAGLLASLPPIMIM